MTNIGKLENNQFIRLERALNVIAMEIHKLTLTVEKLGKEEEVPDGSS